MNVLIRNNVQVRGEGPPMMFSHGFGCDQTMWRLVAPAFEAKHQVILFDHVGSGRSSLEAYRPEAYGSLDRYAADIVEIVEALDVRDVTFVGHSVSSMIGALAVKRAPDRFAALVMVGPSPCYIDDSDYRGGFSREDIAGLLETLDSNWLGWSSTMAPVIMGAPDQPQLSEELENSFCRMDPDIAKQFARATFLTDCRSALPDLEVPTLVVQCSRDAIAPVEVGEYVHRAVPGSRYALIDTTGHCPHLSAPRETIAAIERFSQTL